MDSLPSFLADYLESKRVGEAAYAVLQLDQSGAIIAWYGDIAFFNQTLPIVGSDVYEYCNVLEGILPLDSQHAVLPHIEILHDCVFADIHLLYWEDCYWILFLDTTQGVMGMRGFLQAYNETNFVNQTRRLKDAPHGDTLSLLIDEDKHRELVDIFAAINPPEAIELVAQTEELPSAEDDLSTGNTTSLAETPKFPLKKRIAHNKGNKRKPKGKGRR